MKILFFLTFSVWIYLIISLILFVCVGPGLALNGPIGSMAKAADGMRSWINHIFTSFIVMTVFFAVSVLASFWAVMTRKASIVTTAIFVASSFFWWRDCMRIYNKFKYAKVDPGFLVSGEEDSSSSMGGADALDREYDEEIRHVNTNANSANNSNNNNNSSSSSRQGQGMMQSSHGSVVNGSGNNGSGDQSTVMDNSQSSGNYQHNGNNGTSSSSWSTDNHQNLPVMKGYLTIREYGQNRISSMRAVTTATTTATATTKSGDTSKYIWSRKYFILTPNGRIFTFKGSKQYADHPNKPKTDRPIELSWYEMHACSFIDDADGNEIYEIRLEYADKDDNGQPIVFRCDTATELDDWVNAISSFTQTSVEDEYDGGDQ